MGTDELLGDQDASLELQTFGFLVRSFSRTILPAIRDLRKLVEDFICFFGVNHDCIIRILCDISIPVNGFWTIHSRLQNLLRAKLTRFQMLGVVAKPEEILGILLIKCVVLCAQAILAVKIDFPGASIVLWGIDSKWWDLAERRILHQFLLLGRCDLEGAGSTVLARIMIVIRFLERVRGRLLV